MLNKLFVISALVIFGMAMYLLGLYSPDKVKAGIEEILPALSETQPTDR